ncbi:TadE/TadG family type IV pilus assembly protein [Streptomyces sp. NPDC053780]|uniref:TadE/TadG family type IV pilus assembly protein n=1 Tax=unclassified Streptomyces TaxID=2593676 RepID=UPI00341F42FD
MAYSRGSYTEGSYSRGPYTEGSYSRGPGGRRARDRGQAAIEYLGFVPILIIVGMAVVQLGLIAYTAQQAGTAARAGARSASLQESAQGACAAAVSSWLADGTSCPPSYGGDEVTVTATVDIPSIVPGWDFDPATRTATMPLDH